MSGLMKYDSLADEYKQPHVHLELPFRNLGPDPSKSPLEPTYPYGDRPLPPIPLPPVDRGIKAWSSIAGGFLALFVQFGLGTSKEPPRPHNTNPPCPDISIDSWARGPCPTPVRRNLPAIHSIPSDREGIPMHRLSSELLLGLPRSSAPPLFFLAVSPIQPSRGGCMRELV